MFFSLDLVFQMYSIIVTFSPVFNIHHFLLVNFQESDNDNVQKLRLEELDLKRLNNNYTH